MKQRLAEELRRIRGVHGASLRDVEKHTGISNAYLSQLENGKTSNPSPQVLYKLASYYAVPYESLMEAAGYLKENRSTANRSKRRVGALQAALMSAQLTVEEQRRVAEFIEFVRSQRGAKGR